MWLITGKVLTHDCILSLFVKVIQILVQGKISRPSYSDKSPSRSTVTTEANFCHSGGKWTKKVVMVRLTMAQFSFMQLGLKCTTDNKNLCVYNPVMWSGDSGSISCDKTTTFSADPICRPPLKVVLYKLIFKSSAKI